MVVSLQEIITAGVLSSVQNAISQFTCKDKDVETFLKFKAFDFERRDKSRTYLLFDDKNNALLGYFTLSLYALPFMKSVSKNTIKRIDGFSKDIKVVGIILIGQFGKDSKLAKDVKGDELIDLCFRTIDKIKKLVGGRFILLECQEIEKVVMFYKNNGFEILQYDERDKYLQMIKRI